MDLDNNATLSSPIDCEEIDLRQYSIDSNASIEEINLEEFDPNVLSELQVSPSPEPT